jgi:hypothetical protein
LAETTEATKVNLRSAQPNAAKTDKPAPPRPAPFKITTPIARKYVNILIYGEPGVGKSYLAGSASDVPEMRDVLYIDVEGGSETLREKWPETPLVPIENFQQIARVYEFLVRHCQARDANDEAKLKELQERVWDSPVEKPYRFNTVVIDSLSEAQRLNMYQLLGMDIGARAAIDQEYQAPEFAEWNKTTEMIRHLVRSFRNLPMNAIFISGDREDDGKKQTIAFPKELGKSLPGFVDAVGFYTAEVKPREGGGRDVERRLFLEAGRRFVAKHRFGSNAVPEGFLLNPSMADIFKLRQGQRG